MRKIIAVIVLSILLAGGSRWNRAAIAADDRASSLDGPIAESDTVAIGLSAAGRFNSDVLVSVYSFGEQDQVAGDALAGKIAYGELAERFYSLGFRGVIVSSDRRSQILIIERQKQFSKLPYSHALLSSTING
jgi:hypothetical protein